MSSKTVVTGVVVFLLGSAVWELLGKPFLEGLKAKVSKDMAPTPVQHQGIFDSIFN